MCSRHPIARSCCDSNRRASIRSPISTTEARRTVFPTKATVPKDRFYSAFVTIGSLTLRAFCSPVGLNAIAAMNAPQSFGLASKKRRLV